MTKRQTDRQARAHIQRCTYIHSHSDTHTNKPAHILATRCTGRHGDTQHAHRHRHINALPTTQWQDHEDVCCFAAQTRLRYKYRKRTRTIFSTLGKQDGPGLLAVSRSATHAKYQISIAYTTCIVWMGSIVSLPTVLQLLVRDPGVHSSTSRACLLLHEQRTTTCGVTSAAAMPVAATASRQCPQASAEGCLTFASLMPMPCWIFWKCG